MWVKEFADFGATRAERSPLRSSKVAMLSKELVGVAEERDRSCPGNARRRWSDSPRRDPELSWTVTSSKDFFEQERKMRASPSLSRVRTTRRSTFSADSLTFSDINGGRDQLVPPRQAITRSQATRLRRYRKTFSAGSRMRFRTLARQGAVPVSKGALLPTGQRHRWRTDNFLHER